MATIVTAVKTSLNLPVLNYQYGYIEELNETLKQMESDSNLYNQKLPLVWLAEPYDEDQGSDPAVYATANPDVFIFCKTDKTWKARDRMANSYKPVLYPIMTDLLNQIAGSEVFEQTIVENIKRKVRKGYYWDDQQRVFNDAVDCLRISFPALKISHKENCTILSSF